MAPDATTTPHIAAAALGSGTSKIAIAPGPSAGVLYIDISLPPADLTSFFMASSRLVLVFSIMLLRACGVYCPESCLVSDWGYGAGRKAQGMYRQKYHFGAGISKKLEWSQDFQDVVRI